MARNIGGVSCDLVRVNYRHQTVRVETWETLGMDGTGYQQLGLGEGRGLVRGVFFATSSNIEAWKKDLEELRGTQITVEDDRAITHPNDTASGVENEFLVEDVESIDIIPVIKDNVAQYRGEAVLRVVAL